MTIDEVPYYQRGYPELDADVLAIAEEEMATCIREEKEGLVAQAEFDLKHSGNSMAFMVRPVAIGAEHLFNWRMRNMIPVLVEAHKSRLGVQTYLPDGTLNPKCTNPQKWP